MAKKRVTKVMSSMEMPKVGDHLKRVMTAMTGLFTPIYEPLDCIVTYVNEKRGWYEVEFTDTHLKECYGLPVFDHAVIKDWRNYPVMCVETGYVYSSVCDCAKDMRIHSAGISRQLSGEYEQCHGYHFTTVL